MADTIFGRMFQRAAAPSLMRQYGELVTYHPADGSQPREITAIVQRQALEVISEIGNQVSESLIVRVYNDRTTGIASEKIDCGGDEIDVATEVNGQRQRRSIVRVLSDANGFVRVLCQ